MTGGEQAGWRISLVISLFLLATMLGCGGDGVQEFGKLKEETRSVVLPELLEAPELYMGERVAVEGRVFKVCQVMGCWFELVDARKTLMVDLQMGRRFTIPEESAGFMARVEGTLVRKDGVLKLIGAGVRLFPAEDA
jgi:hypothetical protein